MERLAIDGGERTRTAPWPARRLFGEEEKAAAVALFDRCIATGGVFGYNGPEEEAYRAAFAEFLGGGLAHTVNSGTSAVLAALAGLGLEPLSEVIVPPISDPGGIMPVIFVGCVPVVADAAPGSFNVNAETIRSVLTERTRALVVAHIAGEPCDMAPILELAQEHGLYVVEDCAQSHGATYGGRLTGTFGHIAAFSTMSGKHHATGAQGGVVFSRDEEIFWRARRFADRGKPFNTDETTNVAAGLNLNLNDLSAAIGLVQLRRLPDIVARRQAVGEAVGAGLEAVQGVSLGRQAADSRSSYWFLRIRVDPAAFRVDMRQFVTALSAEGIPCGWPYSTITSEAAWWANQQTFGGSGWPWRDPCYRGDRQPRPALPVAHQSRDEHFTLHIHENCGEREVADIVSAIAKVADAYRA